MVIDKPRLNTLITYLEDELITAMRLGLPYSIGQRKRDLKEAIKMRNSINKKWWEFWK